MKYNDFNECLKMGERGEQITKDKLEDIFRPVIHHYLYGENVLSTQKQRNGIDFTIQKDKIDFDVKCRDYYTYKYKDILIETISVVEQNKPGWLYTSKSDIIVYVWYNNNKTGFVDGYLLFMNDINEFITTYKVLNTQIKIAKTYNRGNTWTTKNIAVPIIDFPDKCISRIDMKKLFPPIETSLFDF